MGQAALQARSRLIANVHSPTIGPSTIGPSTVGLSTVEPRGFWSSAQRTCIRGPGRNRIHAALKNSAGAMIVHNPPCRPAAGVT